MGELKKRRDQINKEEKSKEALQTKEKEKQMKIPDQKDVVEKVEPECDIKEGEAKMQSDAKVPKDQINKEEKSKDALQTKGTEKQMKSPDQKDVDEKVEHECDIKE